MHRVFDQDQDKATVNFNAQLHPLGLSDNGWEVVGKPSKVELFSKNFEDWLRDCTPSYSLLASCGVFVSTISMAMVGVIAILAGILIGHLLGYTNSGLPWSIIPGVVVCVVGTLPMLWIMGRQRLTPFVDFSTAEGVRRTIRMDWYRQQLGVGMLLSI
jgi:hypothetical protein